MPTAAQGIICIMLCQSLTNTFTPIFVVRFDEGTANVFIVAGDSIEIEIYPNDKVAFSTFVNRLTASAKEETFAPPQSLAEVKEIEKLIQQRVEQLKTLSS